MDRDHAPWPIDFGRPAEACSEFLEDADEPAHSATGIVWAVAATAVCAAVALVLAAVVGVI